MTKQQLLEQFMILIATMQNIAVDIIDEKSYNDFGDFMDDIFSKLEHNTEDEPLEVISSQSNRVFGNVDRQRVMQEIGDNQALMIFGQDEIKDEEF